MKDLFSFLGIVALIGMIWLGLITIEQDGVKTLGENGEPVEVLTFSGWQPLSGNSSTAIHSEPAEVARAAAAPPATQPPPPPTTIPQPTTIPIPTPLPTAAAAIVREAPPTRVTPPGQRSSSPQEWDQDPTGMGTYAATDSLTSPWEVLGWVLVGTVPTGLLFAAGLYAYRHVALTQAQVQILQQTDPTATRPAPGADEPPEKHSQQQLDIAAYLAGQSMGPYKGWAAN